MRASRPTIATPSSSPTAVSSKTASSPAPSSSRLRRTSTAIVEPQHQGTPRTPRSTAVSTSRTPAKRKVEPAETSPSPRTLKRKRSPSKEDEVKLLAKRLKDAEKDLRQRESALKKREAAITRKENTLQKKQETMSRKIEIAEELKKDYDRKRKVLTARDKELAAQEKALAKQEAAAMSALALSPTGDAVEPLWALAHLEEHFTCSLCYEIMACPYTLTPGRCGHSFCALCALQWCFAAVHRGCGYWHDSLECPLCRAELPYTSDRTPRSMFSFPFTPNRLADSAIKALITLIKDAKPSTGAGAGAVACAASGSARKAGVNAAGPREDDRIAQWRDNGMLYTEWESRERRGREEMTILANEWSELNADDFVAFKDRLAV
ncbi:hypothetical protein BV20DRAFT_823138 [Pilatotrama ljubarskyi]|nr:hypothetical protein BV20DRAFT_823138 [Pilatotrama ljubarskyi]